MALKMQQALPAPYFHRQSQIMVQAAYAQETDATPVGEPDGMPEGVAGIADVIIQGITTLPVWLVGAIALGLCAFLLFGIAALKGRIGEPLGGEPVTAPRRPAAGSLADEAGPAHEDVESEPAEEPVDEPAEDIEETEPLVEAMAEEMADQGVLGEDLDQGLRRFADGLDGLKGRLSQLTKEHPHRSPLLKEAEAAVQEGDVAQGIELLVSAADAEANSSTGARNQSDSHGRAAAEARMIAADLLAAQKAFGEATTLYKRALSMVPEDEPELRVECLNRSGAVFVAEGAFEQAAQMFAEALSIMEGYLGPNHGELTPLMNNLALAKDGAGDLAEAEKLYQRALQLDERIKGPSDPDVAADLNNLGLLYKRAGRSAVALPLLRRALKIKRGAYPDGHPSLVTGLRNLAAALRDEGDVEEAAELEREANILPPAVAPQTPDVETA